MAMKARKKSVEALKNSVKGVVLDQDGFAVDVVGSCKASDFQEAKSILRESKEDVMIDIGVRRMM